MSSEIKVKNLEIAEDTQLRRQSVKIGKSWIQTPIKSISPEKLYAKSPFPKEDSIIEIFKKINPDKLSKIFNEKKEELKLTNSFNNLSLRGNENNPSFIIIQYDSPKIPSKENAERLSRLSHALSDIAPIPSIPKAVRGDGLKLSNLDEFLDYIKNCIKTLKDINNKQIMGYVPPISQLFVEKLIDLYIDEGINAYYFDSDGDIISSHIIQIDAMKRKLKSRGYEENHFIHYTNAKHGSTAINNTNIIPAQDITGFIRGMDSFGGIHVGSRRPPEYFKWLKENKNVEENSIRLFDKKGYGYHRMFSSSYENELRKVYPSDSQIKIDEIDFKKKGVVKRFSEIVNMEQQIIESKNISNKIHEEPKKTADYFIKKQFLGEGLLKKLLRRVKQ